jgi:MFS family permease
VGIVVWTLGEIIQAPLNFAVVADLAPVERRGQYQGLFQMSWGASLILAPLVGSFVLQQFGGAVLWMGCLVLGVLLGIGQLALAPGRGRRLAQLSGSGLSTALD